MSEQQDRRRRLTVLVVVLLLLVLEAWFLRGVLKTDNLIGDAGDARLNNFIAEHWYNVALGRESAANLPIFYPIANTVSYTDLLIGFSIPYSVFRSVGVDMFLANKLTLILFHLAGTLFLYALLRKYLRFSVLPALTGTVVCAFASAYSIRFVHTQMFAFSMVPMLLYAMAAYHQRLSLPLKKRLAIGLLTIALYALMWYTSFYTAYFTALFLLIFSVAYFILSLWRSKRPFARVWGGLKTHALEICLALVVFAALMVPFILIYLPSFQSYGARSFDEVNLYLPRIWDLFNASPHSLMYGRLFSRLPATNHELWVGFPPVTFALFVFAAGFHLIHFLRERKALATCTEPEPSQKAGMDRALFLFAVAASVLFSMLLIVNWGDGISLWRLAYRFLPGAAAMRAVARYLLILTLPAGVCIAALIEAKLQNAHSGPKAPLARAAAALLLVLLVLDNSVVASYASHWNRSVSIQANLSVPSPPPDCKVMYYYDEVPSDQTDDHAVFQLDAWQTGIFYGIPTINGYSGQFPYNWHDLWSPDNPLYLSAADYWINTYHLEGVYAYLVQSRRWVPHSELMKLKAEQTKGINP